MNRKGIYRRGYDYDRVKIIDDIVERIVESYDRCPLVYVKSFRYTCANCIYDIYNDEYAGCDRFKNALYELFLRFWQDSMKRPNLKCRGVPQSIVPDPFRGLLRELIRRKIGLLHGFLYFSGRYYRPTNRFLNVIRGRETLEDAIKYIK